MINKGLYSSASAEWETPQELFEQLNKEFEFDVDVCATAENTKCKEFFSPQQDGLSKPWEGVAWMNPPYGREICEWMHKAYDEAECGSGTIVCLVPAHTDTKWWHDWVMKATEIRLIKGRLKFNDSKNSAPFPSAIVIFEKNNVNKEAVKVTAFEVRK